MKKDIPKAYDASKVEDRIYKMWEDSGFFNPDNLPGKRKEVFTISMPPPNATGILHIGHAMFLTIQDLVIRYKRMRGMKTLWLPGTDHAAIATQAKVEKILKKEGKSKYDLGRDGFLARVNEFVQESQKTMRMQMRKMGSSCDWSRERYTLDEGLSHAVREAFVKMYQAGLIYRGERIVNWCPHCESTLADDEIEYREQKSNFYYFKYGPFIIGTVRPETKMGDKVVIVYPRDTRYTKYHGKTLDVPWIDGIVQAKVIADPIADPKLGSGAMTITPGHSFVDFELAKKYKIPIVKMIDEKGRLTSANGKYAGLKIEEARKKFVEVLESKGLLDHIDPNYIHNLSICYRCGTPIEPMPSEQWFVDVSKRFKISAQGGSAYGGKDTIVKFPRKEASLKDLALHVVKSGQIKIIPQRFEKIYFYWLNNLHDWCISRQIWFGHRIPVWYCKSEARNMKYETNSKFEIRNSKFNNTCPPIVSIEKPKKCPNCGNTHLEQDPDTLDTWFSSGLWTFSTLGWPQKTKDITTYHPTSFMETGYDIIFFWVARMILLSNFFMGEVPFRQVYLHGLVKDEKGRKMSKSLDNIIDPLDVILKYGTDAIRLSLLIGTTPGNDLNLGESKIAGYRNFTNKLWNISRYVITSVDNVQRVSKTPKPETIFDKWILSRFHDVASKATVCLEKYEFSAAGELLREFTWNEFADWYLEISKIPNPKSQIPNKLQIPNFKTNQQSAINNQQLTINNQILLYILERLLILWHPFMPFVTEEIWKNFSNELLMIQPWPNAGAIHELPIDISEIQNIIIAIRNLKAENKLANKKDLKVVIVSKNPEKILKNSQAVIEKLAGAKVEFAKTKPQKSISAVVGKIEIHIPREGAINKASIEKEITNKEQYIKTLEKKLSNPELISKAPKQVVENERKKLADQKEELKKLKENLE